MTHKYIIMIRDHIEKNGINSFSLFTGLAGLNFVISSVFNETSNYKTFYEKLNNYLYNQFFDYFNLIKNRESSGKLTFDYDLIHGVTGIGRYLLCNAHISEQAEVLLCDILTYLVNITKKIKVKKHLVPGWYITDLNKILPTTTVSLRGDYFDCGVAHGIPGPLSLLTLTLSENISVQGQEEAIEVIFNWLFKWKIQYEHGYNWPSKLSFNEEINGKTETCNYRNAWCYGSIGVMRVLYLASRVINNKQLSSLIAYEYKSLFSNVFVTLKVVQ